MRVFADPADAGRQLAERLGHLRNRRARASFRCTCRLTVVAGATHLFEEPGTLAEAALLARDWFERYLMAQHDQPSMQVAR